jgi:hypothetical protein
MISCVETGIIAMLTTGFGHLETTVTLTIVVSEVGRSLNGVLRREPKIFQQN